jgi:hypothetical protein
MLKEQLRKLPQAKRSELMFAFNEEIPFYVEIQDGDFFIGVYLTPGEALEVLETEGVWSYGRLR